MEENEKQDEGGNVSNQNNNFMRKKDGDDNNETTGVYTVKTMVKGLNQSLKTISNLIMNSYKICTSTSYTIKEAVIGAFDEEEFDDF